MDRSTCDSAAEIDDTAVESVFWQDSRHERGVPNVGLNEGVI